MFTHAKKIGFAVIAIVAMTAVIPTTVHAKKASKDQAIAAIVNGSKILKKDVLKTIKDLSVKQEDTAKVFPVVVDQMINEKLITAEIKKEKIESDPVFKERLAIAKSQLIKTIYMEKKLKEKVTPKAVKDEYAILKKENAGKKEAHARHILLATEEEAKQVVKDLDAGEKFAELAMKRSSGPTAQKGGDVGYFAEGEIIPEFSKAAFALEKGTYTKEPVKSQFGWHVIFVEDFRDRKVPPMKEVEASIRNKLGQEAITKIVDDLRSKAKIKRFGMDGEEVTDIK